MIFIPIPTFPYFYRLTPVSKPVNKRLVIFLLLLGQDTHKHLKLVNPQHYTTRITRTTRTTLTTCTTRTTRTTHTTRTTRTTCTTRSPVPPIPTVQPRPPSYKIKINFAQNSATPKNVTPCQTFTINGSHLFMSHFFEQNFC